MKKNVERKKAICILGMHRSGTSTITRGLNLLGVYLGEEKDLMHPKPDNPEGYWERLDLYYLQERLLSTLKRPWDTCMPLPEGWQDASEVKPFRDELIAIIKQNFSGVPLWGWKDPRSTLFIDLWKNILEELEIELAVVLAVRNPVDVALSLKKRDGIPCDKGFGIWFNYNITALRAITKNPTVFMSYDNFLTNWEPELRKCSQSLDIEWPQEDADFRLKMNSFIRSDLRHSCSTLDDLKKAGAPQPVRKLYELLLRLLDGDAIIDNVSETVNDLYEEFFAYARFYQHDTVFLWEVEQKLVAAKKQLEEYALQLAERDNQLSKEYQRVQELLNSESWKITRPLRKIYGLIKNIL